MLQTKVQNEAPMTTQILVDHVKAVGQAIIDDADKIAFDACDLTSLVIRAVIEPGEGATTVTYRLERLADPRIGKEQYGRTEET